MQHRDRDSGRSEQLNDEVRPHGRFSFSIATCGSRVLMVGGGTDYRVAADETWVWEPTIRTVENPEEAAGRTGHWTRVYGNGPFEDMAAPRPRGAGPLRPVAFAIANQDQLGASDIYLFGGVNNQSAGLFIHKGFETSEMWRWRCTPQSWPDALVASPPMPPSPPPPPSLPPGEYDGGTHGYYAHYTYRPWHVDEPPNHRMSINDELHEAGREAK